MMTQFCKRCRSDQQFERTSDGNYCCVCGYSVEAAENWFRKTQGNNKEAREFRKSIFGVELYDDFFTYLEKKYLYSEIESLDPSISNTKYTRNFIPEGSKLSVSLKIKFTHGKKILFSNNGSRSYTIGSQKNTEQKRIIEIYEYLSRKTGIS